MSSKLSYRITLLADAEPGSGFGSNSVNQYVTRDGSGLPMITASHMKGLVRQCLTDMFKRLQWDQFHIDNLLGAPGWRPALRGDPAQAHHSGVESGCRFENASLTGGKVDNVRLLVRTAIDSGTGTIVDQSLRTTEAVRSGTTFQGAVHCHRGDQRLLVLGLTAIGALGSGRNRGSGACAITIDDIKETPGQMLRVLAPDMSRPPSATPHTRFVASSVTVRSTDAGTSVFFNLVFHAAGPVLCPDLPETHNLLRSGLSIPASAVQGALLHLIGRTAPEMADACFHSDRFRAWPLQPVPENCDGQLRAPPVRVSITHRSAKLISDPALEGEFFDEALDRWEDRSPDAPVLKTSDGVLIPQPDGTVTLWRANDVPRLFSTHGVHSDRNTTGGRNLFSVEAINAKIWQGVLAVPAEFADQLASILKACDVSFGKGRSVRGGGTLTASLAGPTPDWLQTHQLLIAQSPILLPPADSNSSALLGVFEQLADQWASTHQLGTVEQVWATQGLRFGWNRHGMSDALPNGRLRAARVAVPGAVIKLKQPPSDRHLAVALIGGIGDGRDRGFGCLLPHPGKANDIYRGITKLPELSSLSPQAVKEGLQLAKKCKLSSSQLSAMSEELSVSTENAKAFLKRQKMRGTRFWQDWKDVYDDLLKIIEQRDAQKILTVARDHLQIQSSQH